MLQTCDKISDDKKIEVSGSIILTQPSYTILARFVVLVGEQASHSRARLFCIRDLWSSLVGQICLHCFGKVNALAFVGARVCGKTRFSLQI